MALAAARLLHLPVTGAVDPERLKAPRGPGDLAGRLRRRYSAWFYGKLDEAYAPTRSGGAGARRRRRRAQPYHAPAGAVRGRRRRRPGLSPAGAARPHRVPVVARATECRPATTGHSESASSA